MKKILIKLLNNLTPYLPKLDHSQRSKIKLKLPSGKIFASASKIEYTEYPSEPNFKINIFGFLKDIKFTKEFIYENDVFNCGSNTWIIPDFEYFFHIEILDKTHSAKIVNCFITKDVKIKYHFGSYLADELRFEAEEVR